jgi:pimeloyl-ACP methyl ester carboxylesterase
MTRQASQPHVEIGNGHHLFLRDWGEGPSVVLLAGWGMDSRLWGDVMLGLNARGLRTIAYDRRGHGRSTDPGIVNYDLLADDLATVLATLDLHDVTIVAHSGAGGEALRYLARHGANRVARLMLVGASGPCMLVSEDNPDGIPVAMLEAVVQQLETDLAGWIDANAEPFAPGASRRVIDWLGAMVMDTSRRMIIDFQREIATADLTAEAASLTVPVTIIHGDRDASAPIDLTARRYAQIIPGAEFCLYEGVAHGVMVTHADRLATDIAKRVLG